MKRWKNRRVWFTSDTHYDHRNICLGTTLWEGTQNRCRPFNTLEEMNDTIVNNINNVVGENDVLIHLGDWSFNGKNNISLFRERLKCREIHLIYGNHDHHIKREKNGLQELFASVGRMRTIYVEGQRIVLCHYSLRVWDKSHDGAWMLYGHSHGTLPMYGKSMDVGMDAHPEFRPYSFEEVSNIMDGQDILFVDHHNERTEHQPKQ